MRISTACARSILPTVFEWNPHGLNYYNIRVRPGHMAEAKSFVEETWNKFVPSLPVRLNFLDETYEKQFAADEKRGEMFAVFAAIAISIACLGLFGLASFTAERRTKEIGIRKVFGASVREHRPAAGVAVLEARADRQPDRLADRLVLFAQLARRLRLPHRPQPALFRSGGAGCARHRLGHGQRPGGARGPRPSGQRASIRVNENVGGTVMSRPLHTPLLLPHNAARAWQG